MPLITHRGSAGLATANSLQSISIGDSYSPKYIEIDINLSSDNIAVIFHGSMIKFLQGKKMNQSFQELNKSNPELITLKELIKVKTISPFIFDIKISDQNELDIIFDILKQYPRNDFAFTSPHSNTLSYMKRKFPSSPTFQNQPYHHGPIRALELASQHNFSGVAINKWWMNPITYYLCKTHNKEIMCYTVDSKFAIRLIARFFPDVLIVTNRPDNY